MDENTNAPETLPALDSNGPVAEPQANGPATEPQAEPEAQAAPVAPASVEPEAAQAAQADASAEPAAEPSGALGFPAPAEALAAARKSKTKLAKGKVKAAAKGKGKGKATSAKAGAKASPRAAGRPAGSSRVAAYADQLGKVPDSQIATKAGVSTEAVRIYRKRQGIAPAGRRSQTQIGGSAPAAPAASKTSTPKSAKAPTAKAPTAKAPTAKAPAQSGRTIVVVSTNDLRTLMAALPKNDTVLMTGPAGASGAVGGFAGMLADGGI